MEADDGEITFSSGATWGYLSQQEAVNSGHTIYEELLSVKQDLLDEEQELRDLEKDMKHLSGDDLEKAMNRYSALQHDFEMRNGYAVKSEITGVLKGLGFSEDEFDKIINTLSGGQKTRVALGKLLLQKPDLIILDDFGMKPIEGQFQNDFEQILDDRYNKKALIIASQLPVSDWYSLFKNELIAEACLDRIIHKAIRFQLKGESLRKKY